MPAAPSSAPRPRTSSPVASTPTCGRRCTFTSSRPTPAASPMTAGVSCVPGSMMGVPAARSLPMRRIEPPGSTEACTAIRGGRGPVASRPRGPAAFPDASSGVVCSTGTTASAPGGIGAPVAMRIAVPRRTSTSGAWPARTSPITSNWTGASSAAAAVSAARIA